MLKKIITSADQFGVPFSFTTFDSSGQFKSVYEGLYSIIVYTIGFSYFVYMTIQWKTYQIPPVVTYPLVKIEYAPSDK
jgi:hypothetical protein